MLSLKCDRPLLCFYVNSPSCFQQWSLNYDIRFPNPSIDSTFGFWNVGLGLCIFPNFSQCIKEMGNLDFWKDLNAFPNFPQFTKKNRFLSPCLHIWSNGEGSLLRRWHVAPERSQFMIKVASSFQEKMLIFRAVAALK